jgi:hypothetical protein
MDAIPSEVVRPRAACASSKTVERRDGRAALGDRFCRRLSQQNLPAFSVAQASAEKPPPGALPVAPAADVIAVPEKTKPSVRSRCYSPIADVRPREIYANRPTSADAERFLPSRRSAPPSLDGSAGLDRAFNRATEECLLESYYTLPYTISA